ncbi:MAG: hypothetical protein AAFQ98_23270 [Bacteroidota bacterium]
MKNFENYALAPAQRQALLGGRTVVKTDVDGDGKWDIKEVYDNDGNIKRVVFRY